MWTLSKDFGERHIIHNSLIRFNNFDEQRVGFLPDICRIAQKYDLTDYVMTYIVQYSQRGTFINPLTPVVRIIHARSNTAAEHPLTLVVMTLAYRDDRTRGFAVVAH